MGRSQTFVSLQRRKDFFWSVSSTSITQKIKNMVKLLIDKSCFRMLLQVSGKGMGDIDGSAYASGWGSWNVSQVFGFQYLVLGDLECVTGF